MPDEQFYNENSQALKPVEIETRNGIPALASQILASRIDLSRQDLNFDEVMRQYYDIISSLQKSYEYLCLN